MSTPVGIAALQAAIAANPGLHARDLSRHDAFRQFWCVDCRIKPYSAGRPRCDDCHTDHLTDRTAGRTSTAGRPLARGAA